jgi:hypothetical protein
VLIHPSAIGQPDIERLRLTVHLTRAQIKASPEISFDLPISEQTEKGIYGYYGWDPEWVGGGCFTGYPAGEAQVLARPGSEYSTDLGEGDPNLRSMAAVNGYHVEARGGAIGHIENFIMDDVSWDVRHRIVDTKNWWFGQHVPISPFAVRHINWMAQNVLLDVSRDRVKNSPPWKPLDLIDRSYQERLHGDYAWPGLLVTEAVIHGAQMSRSRCFELSSCSISVWRLPSSRMRSARSLSFTSAKWTEAPSGKSRSVRTTGRMPRRNGHCTAGFAKKARQKERMFCCNRTTSPSGPIPTEDPSWVNRPTKPTASGHNLAVLSFGL